MPVALSQITGWQVAQMRGIAHALRSGARVIVGEANGRNGWIAHLDRGTAELIATLLEELAHTSERQWSDEYACDEIARRIRSKHYTGNDLERAATLLAKYGQQLAQQGGGHEPGR